MDEARQSVSLLAHSAASKYCAHGLPFLFRLINQKESETGPRINWLRLWVFTSLCRAFVNTAEPGSSWQAGSAQASGPKQVAVEKPAMEARGRRISDEHVDA